MVNKIVSAGLAAALLALPLAADAVQGPTDRTLTLQSRITQALRAGEYDGELRLTVSPKGAILGTYHDEQTGRVSEVRGAVYGGNSIWLSGPGVFGRYHFTGTLIGSTIDAHAYNGADDLHLIANPTP